ncbi:uncharacterized protein LOC110716549 isoform X1 [Chenopodium quinoa]|uniref:Uncharacterized protein n=1 Tax=Chenopodium quinoa TaxID=63459 RepID=A0A803NB27_CHEQI|nr:uncharacterized protein LOC110716549 isoform X1 [Chenopodium quinoa]
MDDSMSSTNYMSQSQSSNCSEESGWTLYFEDFLSNNKYDNIQDHQEEDYEHTSFSSSHHRASRKLCNSKLISQNRKIYPKKFVDEELEDTASSPSHSPKVNDLNDLYMKSKQLDTQDVYYKAYNSNHFQRKHTKDDMYTSLSHPSQEINGLASQKEGEGIDMDFLETQLRKKGLCLVPMSMLLNQIS